MGICDTERRWHVFKIQLILEGQIALKTVSWNQAFTASGKEGFLNAAAWTVPTEMPSVWAIAL
jgi:hypothetical protein